MNRLDYTNKRFKIIMPLRKGYFADDGFYYIEYGLSTNTTDLEKERASENCLKGMVEQAPKINGFEAHEYGLDETIGPVVDSWIIKENDIEMMYVKVRVKPSLTEKIKEHVDTGTRLGGSFGGICLKDHMEKGIRVLDEVLLLDATLTPLPVNFDTLGTARESTKECKNGVCRQVYKSIEDRYFKIKDTKETNDEEEDNNVTEPLKTKGLSIAGNDSYEHIRQIVAEAVYDKYDTFDSWSWVIETFPESVWIELHSEGKTRFYEIPYTIDDDTGEVTLGEPVEVETQNMAKMIKSLKLESKEPKEDITMDKEEMKELLDANKASILDEVKELIKTPEPTLELAKSEEAEVTEVKEIDENKIAENVTANVLKALGIEPEAEEEEPEAKLVVMDAKTLEQRDEELIQKTLKSIAKARKGEPKSKRLGGPKFLNPEEPEAEPETKEVKKVSTRKAAEMLVAKKGLA